MEEKKISIAIIGCGGRGGTYGALAHNELSDFYSISALCDVNKKILELRKDEYGISDENCFSDEEVFFSQKRADLLVIGTQDQDHARMTMKGMALGYDILVEKPFANSKEECMQLLEMQRRTGKQVFVCHVLRYAPAYQKAERLLKKGMIGKLVSISDTEQIWYGHFAHSFVRGNWRNCNVTAPMIIAKSCHDLDMLQHLAGAKCCTISSIGELTWFKTENAPDGAAERCTDCKFIETCPYSAKRIYIDRLRANPGYVFSKIITRPDPLTEENVWKAIKTGPYGRCVYHCDNNVCDNQMCMMTFENGVKAVLSSSAFTGNGGRIIHLNGTLGEIVLNEEERTLTLKMYGREQHDIWKTDEMILTNNKGHEGGDEGLMSAIYRALTGNVEGATTLEDSIESHLMGFAAEESRLTGGKLVRVHS